MAGLLSGEPSLHGSNEGNHRTSHENRQEGGGCWYFSRKEIEENSPSRHDGIDLKKETYLRKSYIFTRPWHEVESTIATVCMFLDGNVEKTHCPLKEVVLVSYEIIHKKDPTAVQKIKQKVFEQQKELILLGEKVALETLGFDLNVHHPYKPLVEAVKMFKVTQNALAQVAWNCVTDAYGFRLHYACNLSPTTLRSAIFLAAKFLKVKLPFDG